MSWTPGDRITWCRTALGGYGYIDRIAGRVVKVGERRVTIEVAEKQDDGRYHIVKRSVDPGNIERRYSPCAALNEEEDAR